MALLRVPLAFAIPGTVLTVVVGAQWLMLSVGSGLCSPNVVLGAFSVGAPVSVIAALALGRGLGLGAVGYLYGFGIGQLCTLVLLLVGVMRVLPADADERERLWPALVEYKLLAAASFAYHLSIWADKPIPGCSPVGNWRRCTPPARRCPGSPSSRRLPGSTCRSRRSSINATARSTARSRGAGRSPC